MNSVVQLDRRLEYVLSRKYKTPCGVSPRSIAMQPVIISSHAKFYKQIFETEIFGTQL